ncbi:MAG: TIGR04348 family glycosyltransferase [Rhodocyclaceae bacterium]|jgi:putative glycosyltransferase (TIGR04348 family)|nr:TIGR04348 family glycosyltransferase [Rhodocyclaceae bacterium]MCE2978565.1 TIGR04348 family glycosyltransferase [Betaproteobacteria bacterium]MCA3074623.1 TIGR04348 family glycosyltransferase [Rhodocyclaceae bacterium]MCA3088904.1 TIGR04348 family glycosyltransferase [Rhodocyclaceae bacterium]MCA3095640.1 TIGR04348 family glycosyltransferase [Rhodocyclaceae bacterium]
MQVVLVTPAPPASRAGNRNTAVRWARLLRRLGHRVRVCTEWHPATDDPVEAGAPADLMLALHARRSHPSIMRFREAYPGRPLVLALTGTDLYRDIIDDPDAQQSLRVADSLVVLQPCAIDELPPALHARTFVVHQSAPAGRRAPPLQRSFEVCVVGHLRDEKDPLLAARALSLLPAIPGRGLPLRVTQVGRALDPSLEREARLAMAADRRYRWLGEVTPGRARALIARAGAMVISSRMEGGANVVSEAIAAGTPVIASHIPGNLGLLGSDWPATFPVGDAPALAALLARVAAEPAFVERLRAAIRARAWIADPAQEQAALATAIGAAVASSAAGRPPAPANR